VSNSKKEYIQGACLAGLQMEGERKKARGTAWATTK
jgi:hypothetical protein